MARTRKVTLTTDAQGHTAGWAAAELEAALDGAGRTTAPPPSSTWTTR